MKTDNNMSEDMNIEELKQAVSLYSTLLVKIAFTYLKSMQDAEDVVQDVFLIYLTKKKEFVSEEHRRNWLVRCTINKCKDLLKSTWFRKWIPIPEEVEYLEPQESDTIQLVWQLEPKYRIPIYLYYCEGYSLREIAEIMDKKVATVGTLLSRGREKLKKMIAIQGQTDYW